MTLALQPFRHLRANRDRVSASEYNRLVDLVAKMARSLFTQGLMDSTGFSTRRPVIPPSTDIRIVEVQNVTDLGDGVYNCYRQTLDATDWTDTAGADRFDDKDSTSVEVFNLLENHVESTYTRGLAKGDRMYAWQWPDDEGNSRWAGTPLTPRARMFRTTEAATGNTQITCNVLLNGGSEASESADILYNVEVYCRISGGSVLSSAIPRLANDEYLEAEHIRGKWWCTTVFQTSEDCDCYSAP